MVDADFRDWIGRETRRSDVVTPRLIEQFRATLAPHLYDAPCPPGLHWCLALPAHDEAKLGPDGAEAKGVFLPPVPLPRRMWAGGVVESHAALVPGTEVERVSRISDVQWREGRRGRMCIVSVSHDIASGGRLAIRERHDILFREGRIAASPEPTILPPHNLLWRVDATAQLLFRFSAMTFNGHRIHYDLPYARDVEGYDGLLVHGPMQAALMLNQIAVLGGRVPPVFTYRCVAPLVAGQVFKVMSRKEGPELRGIITNAAGVTTLEAEAERP